MAAPARPFSAGVTGGVFVARLATGAARTARATGARRPALQRLLGREGFTVVDHGPPAEVAVHAADDGPVVLRHDGRTSRLPDLESLARAVRGLTPTGLRAADPADVAAVLHRVAGLGPYFAVTTGPPAGPGWGPVRALYDDATVLADLVGRVAVRLGTEEARVAASVLFQGHAARLWSVGLGALVQERRVPDLDPDALLWRDQNGSVVLHLRPAEGWQGEHLEDVLRRGVVANHLAPLIAALRRLCPLPARLLWGNAASALLGAARVLDDGAAADPVRQVANRLLAHEPLCGTVEERPGGQYRRRSCCLYYRIPGGALCGDCALTSSPIPRVRQST